MIKDSILIRLRIILLCLITSFMFSSCGLLALFTIDDPLDSVECMSPEDLTRFMNNQFPEASFKLISTDFVKDKYDYKQRVVYLSAANLPGKTIIAIQSYVSSRMTVVTHDFFFYTDYLFYKNENEIYAAFKNLYSPLTAGLEENQWKLVIKPEIYSFSFYTTMDNSEIKKDNYSSIEKIIQYTRYQAYLLINKDFLTEAQSDYISFMNDLQRTYEEEGRNYYWYDYYDETKERTTPYANLHCYYSTSLPAAEVTEKDLISSIFGSKQGVIVPESVIEAEQE